MLFKGLLKMIRYDVDKLEPGMVVGEAVHDKNKKLLIGNGFVLKEQHIAILKNQNVATLLIEVEGTEHVVPEKVVSQETRNELAKVLKKSESSILGVLDQKHLVESKVKKAMNSLPNASGSS